MIKYETLPTVQAEVVYIFGDNRPELVHLDDPAHEVMNTMAVSSHDVIGPDIMMDAALNEMKFRGTHILIVVDDDLSVLGVVSSEDILGEKPIQLIEQGRVERAMVSVKMIMTAVAEMAVFELAAIESAKVGNIVNTLNELGQYYALVVSGVEGKQVLCGLFDSSQIRKQLHVCPI